MTGNLTFAMIKPDAVRNGNAGEILQMINSAGFRIAAMKMTRLSMETASKFYEVHKDQPFYGILLDFMTSGPSVALVLEKENAVEDFRTLIGSTDPNKAEEGTIRKKFATNVKENAVHGSDSDENALREAKFHFAVSDIYDANGNCVGY